MPVTDSKAGTISLCACEGETRLRLAQRVFECIGLGLGSQSNPNKSQAAWRVSISTTTVLAVACEWLGRGAGPHQELTRPDKASDSHAEERLRTDDAAPAVHAFGSVQRDEGFSTGSGLA